MQHARIPKAVYQKLEQLQRAFVWVDTEEHHKPHLVCWEVCCLPKANGGLGFRRLDLVNNAFIMKLVWGVISNPNALWAQVLNGKYGRNINARDDVVVMQSDYSLRRAMASMWALVLNNSISMIGNRRGT